MFNWDVSTLQAARGMCQELCFFLQLSRTTSLGSRREIELGNKTGKDLLELDSWTLLGKPLWVNDMPSKPSKSSFGALDVP